MEKDPDLFKEIIETWNIAILKRQQDLDLVKNDYIKYKAQLENVINDTGADLMLKKAREELNRHLSNKQVLYLDKILPTLEQRAKNDLSKNDKLYRELQTRIKQTQGTLRQLKFHQNMDFVIDKMGGLLHQQLDSQTKTDFANIHQKSIAQLEITLKENQQQSDKIIKDQVELLVDNERQRMIQENHTQLEKLDQSFHQYRSEIKNALQDLNDYVNNIHQEIVENRSLVENLNATVGRKVLEYSNKLNEEMAFLQNVDRMAIQQRSASFVIEALQAFRDSFRMENVPNTHQRPRSNCSNQNFDITPYQKLVGRLMDKRKGFDINGLVLYHDVGTGKSCSIILMIESFYRWYLQDKTPKKVEPIILVLIQNKKNLTSYAPYLAMGCRKYSDTTMEMETDSRFTQDPDRTRVYRMNNPKNKNLVMRVVFHRMNVKLPHSITTLFRQGITSTKDYCGNIIRPQPDSIELPHIGAVIVDESHNLFYSKDIDARNANTSRAPNNITFLKQILERRDLPIVFSSGTPVADENSFVDLARLIDAVKRPCDGENRICPKELKVHLWSKDLDTKAENHPLHQHLIDQWFDQVVGLDDEEKVFRWKPGKEEEFKQLVSGYVSFMTLESDITRYPRNVARFPQQPDLNEGERIGYRVVWNFDSENNSNYTQPSVAIKVENMKTPMVKMEIPSNPSTWKHLNGKKRQVGILNRHFADAALPTKWYVLLYLLNYYRSQKHFIFHPSLQSGASSAEQVSGFRKPSVRNTKVYGLVDFLYEKLECREISYWNPIESKSRLDKFAKQFGHTVDLVDKWMDFEADAWFNTNKPGLRCAILQDMKEESTSQTSPKRDNDFIMRIYNDERNKHGDYIRYLLANMSHKEGLNVLQTEFCHIMEPPSATSALHQAMARIKRFCSFKHEPDVTKWRVTTFLYAGVEPSKTSTIKYDIERRLLEDRNDGSPVALGLKAMEEAAIDCTIFSNYLQRGACYLPKMNGIPPHLLKEAMVNGMCHDLRGHNLYVLSSRTDLQGKMITEEDCFARQMLPGGLLLYNDNDELLYQILVKKGYEPIPLAKNIDFRSSRFMYKKWARTTLSELALPVKVGSFDDGKKISVAFDTPASELMGWISSSEKDVGNAILYLLTEKRKSVADINQLKHLEQIVDKQYKVYEIQQEKNAYIKKYMMQSVDRIETLVEKSKLTLEILPVLERQLEKNWNH